MQSSPSKLTPDQAAIRRGLESLGAHSLETGVQVEALKELVYGARKPAPAFWGASLAISARRASERDPSIKRQPGVRGRPTIFWLENPIKNER